MIHVRRAPAFATIQDGGRRGHRASGVPPSGAMDWLSLAEANLLVGNVAAEAAIEWALTGGELEFQSEAMIALAGAAVEGTLNGRSLAMRATLAVSVGSVLTVSRLVGGRFLYVAVSGGANVPAVLGSRSTYLSAGIGGLEGRRLKHGDMIPVGARRGKPVNAASLPARDPSSPLRISPGPQWDLFSDSAHRALVDGTFTVAAPSDRSGYRLDGPPIATELQALPPSEPACVGAMQIAHGGRPIVLMPDGPTTGGYPKIASVALTDLPALAQKDPTESVRFELESADASHERLRSVLSAVSRLEALTGTAGRA